jgi:hypothetical protein
MARLTIDDPTPGTVTVHPGRRPAADLVLRDGTMAVELHLEQLDVLDELILTLADVRNQLVRAHAQVRGRNVAVEELGEGDEIVLDGQRRHVEHIVISTGSVLVRCEDGHRAAVACGTPVLVLGDPPAEPPAPALADVIDAFGARS